MSNADLNKNACEAFAACFDPPLNVVSTRNVGGAPASDAYMCAAYNEDEGKGLTCIVSGKQRLRAWVEFNRSADDADIVGKIMAEVYG